MRVPDLARTVSPELEAAEAELSSSDDDDGNDENVGKDADPAEVSEATGGVSPEVRAAEEVLSSSDDDEGSDDDNREDTDGAGVTTSEMQHVTSDVPAVVAVTVSGISGDSTTDTNGASAHGNDDDLDENVRDKVRVHRMRSPASVFPISSIGVVMGLNCNAVTSDNVTTTRSHTLTRLLLLCMPSHQLIRVHSLPLGALIHMSTSTIHVSPLAPCSLLLKHHNNPTLTSLTQPATPPLDSATHDQPHKQDTRCVRVSCHVMMH